MGVPPATAPPSRRETCKPLGQAAHDASHGAGGLDRCTCPSADAEGMDVAMPTTEGRRARPRRRPPTPGIYDVEVGEEFAERVHPSGTILDIEVEETCVDDLQIDVEVLVDDAVEI